MFGPGFQLFGPSQTSKNQARALLHPAPLIYLLYFCLASTQLEMFLANHCFGREKK